MGRQQEVRGLFLALFLCDSGQAIEVSCSWLIQLLVLCLLYLTLGIASRALQSEVLELGDAGGREPCRIYMYQSKSIQETAYSTEVTEDTSIKVLYSMDAIKLRVPSGLRSPPPPQCRLSYPFWRGVSGLLGNSLFLL